MPVNLALSDFVATKNSLESNSVHPFRESRVRVVRHFLSSWYPLGNVSQARGHQEDKKCRNTRRRRLRIRLKKVPTRLSRNGRFLVIWTMQKFKILASGSTIHDSKTTSYFHFLKSATLFRHDRGSLIIWSYTPTMPFWSATPRSAHTKTKTHQVKMSLIVYMCLHACAFFPKHMCFYLRRSRLV